MERATPTDIQASTVMTRHRNTRLSTVLACVLACVLAWLPCALFAACTVATIRDSPDGSGGTDGSIPDAHMTDAAAGDDGGDARAQDGGNDARVGDAGADGAVGDGGSACPTPCDDGNPCNGTETCDETTGLCQPGTPIQCDDGNPCNGTETCNSASGECQSGTPISCDDQDPCNGMETCNPVTGLCDPETFPSCPTAPPECGQSGGAGAPVAGQITLSEAGGFRLYDENQWSVSEGLVAQIAAHSSVTAVTLSTLLGNLNRTATRVTSLPDAECFGAGFQWNAGDNDVTYWYPQGITGTGDAYASGLLGGRDVGMVSWYHKPENDSSTTANKGVRLAIYDVTNMNSIGYRLVLLVKPALVGGTPSYEAVPIHAGGIVWYGDYLYVADTSRGIRVFDLTRILEVQTGNNAWLGLVSEAEGYHAYGYRYVIPEVTRYRLCQGSCCARFSFLGLDRSTTPHSLLAGEYSDGNISGRLHRWPLHETTGRLLFTGGRAQSTQAVYPGTGNMQGAVSWNGRYYVSRSGGAASRGLYTGLVGGNLVRRSCPYGPEDLSYAPVTGYLWGLTEHPGTRYVYAVNRAQLQAGCP